VSDRNQALADQYLDLFQGVEVVTGQTIEVDYPKLNAFFGSLREANKPNENVSEEEFEEIHKNTQTMLNDTSLFGDTLDEQRPDIQTIKERIDGLTDQRIVPIYFLRDLLMRRVAVKDRSQLSNLQELTASFSRFIR
jgi:hypothetical protein